MGLITGTRAKINKCSVSNCYRWKTKRAYRTAMETREMGEPVSVDVTTSLLGKVVECMSAVLAAAAAAG